MKSFVGLIKTVVVGALLALIGFGTANAAAAAISSPQTVRASYQIVKAGIVIGTVEETFQREGDRYTIVSNTRTAGPVRLFLKDRLTITATGRIGAGGLEPTAYEFRREKNPNKNINAQFDWAAHRIVSSHNDTTENFDLPAGTLDRVSAMYQFMFAAPRGEQVTTWMSQGKRAEQYVYRKRGESQLRVGDKQFATVHYARDAQAGESRAELWLAKDQFFLPVRMVFDDGNVSLEQTLVALSTQ